MIIKHKTDHMNFLFRNNCQLAFMRQKLHAPRFIYTDAIFCKFPVEFFKISGDGYFRAGDFAAFSLGAAYEELSAC